MKPSFFFGTFPFLIVGALAAGDLGEFGGAGDAVEVDGGDAGVLEPVEAELAAGDQRAGQAAAGRPGAEQVD